MDAITKALAGVGTVSESEALPLDEHVKAAWSLADADTGAGDCFAALPSGLQRMPVPLPELGWLQRQGNPVSAKPQPRPAPRAAAVADATEADAATAAAPGSITSIPAALTPHAAPFKNARFAPASAGDLPRKANVSKSMASNASRAAPSNMMSAASPDVSFGGLPDALQDAPRHIPEKSSQSASHTERQSTPPMPSSIDQYAHPAAADEGAVAPKHAVPIAQADFPAKQAVDIGQGPETNPPAVSREESRDKRAAHTAASSEPSAPSALPLQTLSSAPGPAELIGNPAQPRMQKQPMRAASTAGAASADAAADVKAGADAGAGPSLTYRFDKWNGNHAVTVHTAAPADLPQPSVQTPAQAWPQAAGQPAAQTPPQAPDLPNAAQYTLSPSDQLVGQRLSEHLARFGRDADLPLVHLRDADEQRQRQQQQRPPAQEADEEDA